MKFVIGVTLLSVDQTRWSYYVFSKISATLKLDLFYSDLLIQLWFAGFCSHLCRIRWTEKLRAKILPMVAISILRPVWSASLNYEIHTSGPKGTKKCQVNTHLNKMAPKKWNSELENCDATKIAWELRIRCRTVELLIDRREEPLRTSHG